MSERQGPVLRNLLLRGIRARWTTDTLIALLLTGWYYRHGLGRLHDHLFDTFDQKWIIWSLEWLRRSFFGSGSIASLFDANIFYPNTNVLAWSDTMLGYLPIYAFFRLFSTTPIFALNCTAMLAVFAGTLGMLCLGRELTGRVSVIAGVVGGVGMLAASMEGHFQLKALSLLAWALVFLVRFIRGSGKAMPWFIAVSAWLFLCSVYYAIMLAVILVSSFPVALVLKRRRFLLWIREALRTVPIAGTTLVLGASLIPVGWVAVHYLKVISRFGGFQLATFVTYSAQMGSLLDAPPVSLLYRSRYSYWGSHESRVFFGLLVLLALVFLIVTWRRWSLNVTNRRIVSFLAFGAVLSVLLAFGPFERNAFNRGVHVPLPALLYIKFFPGFSALRTIGRFGVFASVFMAVLAEVGIRNVLDSLALDSAKSRWGYVALGLLFLLEQTTVLKPQQIELFPRRPIYEAVRVLTPPEAVVLELPLAKRDHFENFSWWLDQIVGSTLHWRRIVIGLSAQESEVLSQLVESYWTLEKGQRNPADFIESLRRIGVTHVVLNRDLMPDEVGSKLAREFAFQGYTEAIVTPHASIFGAAPSIGSSIEAGGGATSPGAP